MKSTGTRLTMTGVCLVLAAAIAWVTFWLSWWGRYRFLRYTVVPGAYVGSIISKVLGLRSNGAAPWALMFVASTILWFALLVGIALLIARVRSRQRAEANHA